MGLTDASAGSGAAWGDYDGDGDLDLFVANLNTKQDFLYRNDGSGTFTSVATSVGMTDASFGRGAAWGDYDGDGDLDLFVANSSSQQDFLYRNNGNGTFTNIATSVGMTDVGWGYGAAWGDYDCDGDLDLFVVNSNNQQDFLYRNDGNGTFTSVATSVGLTDASDGRGAAWGDYDGDGDLDLFVANYGQQDFLYRNNGNGTFTQVATSVGMTDAAYGYGAAWGDYDGDGDLDLFVANSSSQQDFLYRNDGNGTFTSVATSVGMTDAVWGYGAAWGDYDGDGGLDLFVANFNQDFLYRNDGSGTFTSLAASVGLTDGSAGAGAAWGDYDGDGDLDLFVANDGTGQDFLYRNDLTGKNYIKVNALTDSNGNARETDQDTDRLAIGARVEIDLDGGANFDTGIGKYLSLQVGVGDGLGQSAAPAHFMVDTRTVVDVRVTFVDGDVWVETGVAVNQTITIKDPPHKVATLVRGNNHQVGSSGIALSKHFEVTAKDAKDFPLSGKTCTFVVSFTPFGATGYTIDSTIVTTTAGGTAAVRLTLGNKNGIYQLTATSETVTTTFTAYTDRVDIEAGKWRMGGPNKKPDTPTLAAVIEDDGFGTRETTGKGTLTSGYRIWRWDPTAGVDADFSRFVVPTSIESGKSYWFKAASAGTLDVDGTVVTDTFQLRLDPGWNMVANPFTHFIDWDSDVRFETFPIPADTSPTGGKKTPAQAKADSIAEDVTFWYEDSAPYTGYRWGPRSVSLGAPLVTSLQIKPWTGCWVYAHRSCTMVFYPNPRDPTGGASVLNQAPRYLSAVYGAVTTGVAEEWTIQIGSRLNSQLSILNFQGGENQTYEDMENFVGVRRTAGLSVRDAPAAPGGVSLSVSRYGEGGQYALLYQGTSNPIWELESYSAGAGDVTILVDNVQNVPAEVSLRLRDEAPDAVIDLLASSTYTYYSGAGETRRLTLSASTSGFSAASSSIKYPAACILTKIFGSPRGWWFEAFRSVRDSLLDSALGRVVVASYYGRSLP